MDVLVLDESQDIKQCINGGKMLLLEKHDRLLSKVCSPNRNDMGCVEYRILKIGK